MKINPIEVFGWYGVVAILVAYAAVSFHVLKPDATLYQVLNLTGALGIVIVSLRQKNYQPAVLNGIWAVVAVVAILQIIF